MAKVFQGAFATKERIGLKMATELLGIKFDGFAHGALPDARNTALVHASILRRLRQEPEPIEPSPVTMDAASSLSSFAQKLSDCVNK